MQCLEKQGVIICDKAADGLRKIRTENWPFDSVSERWHRKELFLVEW